MRLLVTGANGFIGTALCQHLVLGDFSVHGLVRAEGQVYRVLPIILAPWMIELFCASVSLVRNV